MRPVAWAVDQWRRSDWMTYVITFIVTSIATITSLELWNAKLSVPLNYTGDAIPTGAHFKTVGEQGWYEYQPLLGAPAGQTYNDFPTADNLHFMMARLFDLVTPNWPTAMNLYYLIGYPLAAIAAVWLFRRLAISRTFSVVLGVLFALAPYHFIRGESHLWLSSYYVIPFAIAVVMDAIQGKPLWGLRDHGPRWLRWASKRTLLTLGILALTGTAQSYYAVFFLVLLAFAGIVRLIRSGEWPRFWGAAIAGGVTAVVMLINMSPDIIYTALNGPNPAGFARGHIEAEIYALKLTQLLLPWPGHRIGILRSIREQYDAHYPLVSESPALGAAGALGLVALFLILGFMAATWGGRRARTADRDAAVPGARPARSPHLRRVPVLDRRRPVHDHLVRDHRAARLEPDVDPHRTALPRGGRHPARCDGPCHPAPHPEARAAPRVHLGTRGRAAARGLRRPDPARTPPSRTPPRSSGSRRMPRGSLRSRPRCRPAR